MKQKSVSLLLKETIDILEKQQTYELEELKNQFQTVSESIKPLNFIKDSVNKLTKFTETNENVIRNVIGFIAGFLVKETITKETIEEPSKKPIKELLTILSEVIILEVISKNKDAIKNTASKIIDGISENFKKKTK